MNQKLLEDILQSACSGFNTSMHEYLPTGTYRDYCLWAFSQENPYYQDYVQVLGLKQLAYLTLFLFEDVVKEENWEELIKCSVPMNVYLAYEFVSDNLAIGLANKAADSIDLTYDLRREVLLSFNNAMCKRLLGISHSAEKLLTPMQSQLQKISSFWQSHNPVQHKVIAHAYLDQHENIPLEELEHAIWPNLVTNIETCKDIVEFMADYSVNSLVLEGLINRYRSVTTLIEKPSISLQDRMNMGIDSSLVIPILAYYVGVFAEAIQPISKFKTVIEKGLLKEVLTKAATLVRLVNDLGTLATQTEKDRFALFDKLRSIYRRKNNSIKTINELLLQASEEVGSIFARIHKDIQLGEFNICVGNVDIMNASSVEDAIVIFEQRLDYFSKLYTENYAHMMTLLNTISNILGEEAPSLIIHRFVSFHEKLYACPYDKSVGDYCV
jgi:hypothetical protein